MKIREIDVNVLDNFWTVLSYTEPNGEVYTQKYGGFRVKECIKKFRKSYRKDNRL